MCKSGVGLLGRPVLPQFLPDVPAPITSGGVEFVASAGGSSAVLGDALRRVVVVDAEHVTVATQLTADRGAVPADLTRDHGVAEPGESEQSPSIRVFHRAWPSPFSLEHEAPNIIIPNHL